MARRAYNLPALIRATPVVNDNATSPAPVQCLFPVAVRNKQDVTVLQHHIFGLQPHDFAHVQRHFIALARADILAQNHGLFYLGRARCSPAKESILSVVIRSRSF